ncbi:MAG: thioredoxin family protein [Fluviicola sp.]
MKKSIVLVFVSLLYSTFQAYAQDNSGENSINWMTFEEALEASESEPKMWFIDMYTDWCGWCKRMDATTFQDEHIVNAINENYYAVKFDAEQKEDIVVGDSTYSFVAQGRRGYHELAAQMMNGKLSYPTYVFLNEQKQVITSVPGYKTNKDMLPILEFISQWTPSSTTDYQAFLLNYESPYETEVEESEN